MVWGPMGFSMSVLGKRFLHLYDVSINLEKEQWDFRPIPILLNKIMQNHMLPTWQRHAEEEEGPDSELVGLQS